MKNETQWKIKELLPKLEKVVAKGFELKNKEITATWDGKDITINLSAKIEQYNL